MFYYSVFGFFPVLQSQKLNPQYSTKILAGCGKVELIYWILGTKCIDWLRWKQKANRTVSLFLVLAKKENSTTLTCLTFQSLLITSLNESKCERKFYLQTKFNRFFFNFGQTYLLTYGLTDIRTLGSYYL